MIDDQDLPVATFSPNATNNTLAPGRDTDATIGPTECVGSGVNRVGQYMMDSIVNRQLPNKAASLINCIMHRWQRDAFLPHPEMNLSNTLEFRKLLEHQPDGFAHSRIGIDVDSVVANLYITDRHRQEELPSASLLPESLQRALPKD